MGAMTPHFFNATYSVKVKASFLTICESTAQVKVSSRLGMDGSPPILMDLPPLWCLFGIKIDLVQLFAGLAADLKSKHTGADIHSKGLGQFIQK